MPVDYVELNPGSGGAKMSADDLGGGIWVQRAKVQFGVDGTATDVDETHGLPTINGIATRGTSSITSGTSDNAVLAVAVSGLSCALLTLTSTSTITAGVLIFEASDDGGTTWFSIMGRRRSSGLLESSYALIASDSKAWSFPVAGWTNVRVRLHPQVTGSGTVSIALSASAAPDISFGGRAILKANSSTLSSVAGSASSVSLLVANPSRTGVKIANDSTATLYIKYGTTASTSSYTLFLLAGQQWEMPEPIEQGALDGIWSSAAGNARITEHT